jgi:hypothetical protein
MSGMLYSKCPVCGRETFVDIEGPTIRYGCHSVRPAWGSDADKEARFQEGLRELEAERRAESEAAR